MTTVDKKQYNKIADEYDGLFTGAVAMAENVEIMRKIGYEKGDKVLDIGCGTGLFLEYNPIPVEDYVGIDPAEKMLAVLDRKYPGHKLINTDFENYMYSHSETRYNKIVALFGVGSYIDPDALKNISELLLPGGESFIMFYAESYHPVTYLKTGIDFSHYAYSPDLIRKEMQNAEISEWKNYLIARQRMA